MQARGDTTVLGQPRPVAYFYYLKYHPSQEALREQLQQEVERTTGGKTFSQRYSDQASSISQDTSAQAKAQITAGVRWWRSLPDHTRDSLYQRENPAWEPPDRTVAGTLADTNWSYTPLFIVMGVLAAFVLGYNWFTRR